MDKPVNPPAFPLADHYSHDGLLLYEGSEGMTLRDWFAGQALAGLLANAVSFGAMMQGHPDAIADVCGTFADAMLREREKAVAHDGRMDDDPSVSQYLAAIKRGIEIGKDMKK